MAHYSPLIAAFFSALVLVSAPAHAAKRIQLSHFPPNPGVAPGGGWKFTPGNKWADPPPQRAWVDGVYGDVRRVGAEDVVHLAGKAGELAVTARSLVTVSEAASVIARCLGNPACIAAAGAGAVVVGELYSRYRVRPAAAGGLEADPGASPSDAFVWQCGAAGNKGITPEAACSPLFATVSAGKRIVQNFSCGVPNVDTTGVSCDGTYFEPSYGNVYWSRTASKTVEKVCRGQTQNGYQQVVGFDGKCPAGFHQPITADEAADKLKTAPPPAVSDALKDALREALKGGQTVEADFETSGPAKQIGSPASTTTTNGQGTTTTTTTPEYHYKYEGDTITYETVNVTQTCVGANACSAANATETKTETKPPPKEGDEKDPCSVAPDRAGCAKLGTPGEGEDIKKKDIPVSITPDSGFGADTGTCPAPIQLANGLTVDPFGLFCKYMAGIRFAVIGVAWLIAAFIFLGRIE
ncbi:hypothetical protein [Roseateles sp.]|jgi:hypothetical protein|uniref:hypothetical protein n=1 Tax=Roseateles sp. TaxID=1971397 RepID=UPI003919EF57